MTPKEKANELVDKFMDYTEHRFNEHNNLSNVYTAKQCTLIAVDEILNLCWNGNKTALNYWENVKNEIEKS